MEELSAFFKALYFLALICVLAIVFFTVLTIVVLLISTIYKDILTVFTSMAYHLWITSLIVFTFYVLSKYEKFSEWYEEL